MNGEWFGFLIWESLGAGFIVWGLYMLSRKKSPVQFWSNAKPIPPEEITDVGAYNRAAGKLVSAYGIAIGLLGILLLKLDSAVVFVPIVMLMILTIAMMATMMRIEHKYRVRSRR